MYKIKLIILLIEQYNLRNEVNYALLVKDDFTFTLQGEGETKQNLKFLNSDTLIEYLTTRIAFPKKPF